ncbi:RNA polymerase sigma factor (sigma-70 family) [Dyadobacter jejuensis]|uniref:RNA polymerase sigma factor (Sigma-70 family) n=1 Tax=Dyadobacter jejuensis TaxID=1082580 RepID=A0A316B9N5_9BACT|nr:sigma-70 family RNA polymerase sigma factor [Dyadobacter jejuensis]PWJ59247.1 RNA polymerase sigma factor (sigma-70 family) [Dyadobacter jejuensis]
MSASSTVLKDLKGEMNHAFGDLYRDYFGTVERFVIHNNGTSADAEDLFQDTMLVLVEKLRQEHFNLTASIKTYVMAIAKHLWLKKLRDVPEMGELDEANYSLFAAGIDRSIENERSYTERLQYYLTKITDHCSRLMQDMFFKNKSIEQIQSDYGYSSKHNAQNQKHKCMKQIIRVKEEDEKK